MKKNILVLLLVTPLLFAFFLIESCGNDDDNNDIDTPSESPIVGVLYTTTNGESTNQVVKFDRHEDGSLSGETVFSTNSLGGANVNQGGDANGDFDSQGAIQIIGNYLLNVNAGGNTISVFSVNSTNGNLTFMGNTDSGGCVL